MIIKAVERSPCRLDLRVVADKGLIEHLGNSKRWAPGERMALVRHDSARLEPECLYANAWANGRCMTECYVHVLEPGMR